MIKVNKHQLFDWVLQITKWQTVEEIPATFWDRKLQWTSFFGFRLCVTIHKNINQ